MTYNVFDGTLSLTQSIKARMLGILKVMQGLKGRGRDRGIPINGLQSQDHLVCIVAAIGRAIQHNTIQCKTCNAPYVTRMLFVGAGMTRD